MPDSALWHLYNKGLSRQWNQLHQTGQSVQEGQDFLVVQEDLGYLRGLEHLVGQGIPVRHVVLAVQWVLVHLVVRWGQTVPVGLELPVFLGGLVVLVVQEGEGKAAGDILLKNRVG